LGAVPMGGGARETAAPVPGGTTAPDPGVLARPRDKEHEADGPGGVGTGSEGTSERGVP